MLGIVPSATLLGIDGHAVTVEVHSSTGLPSFTVVGSPDSACREASGRVRAALLSSGCIWPQQRVTVNLAPPSVRKIGVRARPRHRGRRSSSPPSRSTPLRSEGLAFLGELGLDGSVRPVAGALCLTEALGERAVVLPAASADGGPAGRRSHDPRRHHAHRGRGVPARASSRGPTRPRRRRPPSRCLACPTWPTSAGSPWGASLWRWRRLGATTSSCSARRAPARRCSPRGCPACSRRSPTEPPSRRRASTRPPVSGCRRAGWCDRPPFRAPHHGASSVALVGGGSATMRPGEISAACNGVLFLDELAEFAQHVLDALRQPLEEGVVRVARAAGTVTFPARFLLVAAMNPCPCGYGGRPGGCRCTDGARARYQRRLSGPLLDRFDLRVEVTRPSVSDLMGTDRSEPTAAVRERVLAARAVAAERGVATNAAIPVDRLDELAPLHPDAADVLAQALKSGRLSARGLHRVRRVARTVADLQDRPERRRHAPPTSPSPSASASTPRPAPPTTGPLTA